MPATIRDVAKKSGVAIGTVSSVINNRGRVAPATRNRVLHAVRELGYDPARNLPHRPAPVRTGTIGLVIPGSITEIHRSYYRAVTAAKVATAEQGYGFQFFFEDEMRRITGDTFHLGREQLHCDGLIVYCPGRGHEDYLRVLSGWEIPLVLIRRQTDLPGVKVITDNSARAFELPLEHLVTHGHRRIGIYTSTRPTYNPDLPGFKTFLAENNLEFNPGWVFDRYTLPRTDKELNRTFDPMDVATQFYHAHSGLTARLKEVLGAHDAPTAIVCGQDFMAVELVKSVAAAGYRVPEDVSVSGCGDQPCATMFEPHLTTARQPAEEMTRAACGLLMDWQPDADGTRTVIQYDNRLLVRASTAGV